VLVHGGGFVIGSRGMKPMRYLATRLCEAGLAVATFDYRRLFRGGNLERSVDDVQVMLRWWAAQSARFDLDPTRVTTAGLSAGATLMLLATAGEPPIPLSHVISVFALYDLSGIRGVVPRILGRALVGRRNPEEWQRRSPLRAPFCSAPLTMLHGTADKLTPIQQAYDYAALRREAGLSTTLHVYDGARHGFFNDDRKPVADKAFADLLEAAWARSGQVAGQAALVGHQTRRTAHTL
jgi:acetyl esterase/lipase